MTIHPCGDLGSLSDMSISSPEPDDVKSCPSEDDVFNFNGLEAGPSTTQFGNSRPDVGPSNPFDYWGATATGLGGWLAADWFDDK